jgi:hypothetical protein
MLRGQAAQWPHDGVLDCDGIFGYIVISHGPAFMAHGIAAVAHIPRKELAKTVIGQMER